MYRVWNLCLKYISLHVLLKLKSICIWCSKCPKYLNIDDFIKICVIYLFVVCNYFYPGWESCVIVTYHHYWYCHNSQLWTLAFFRSLSHFTLFPEIDLQCLIFSLVKSSSRQSFCLFLRLFSNLNSLLSDIFSRTLLIVST